MLSLLRVRMFWLDVGIKIYTTDTAKLIILWRISNKIFIICVSIT